MVKLVDTRDLKSLDPKGRAGSTPVRGTKSNNMIDPTEKITKLIASNGLSSKAKVDCTFGIWLYETCIKFNYTEINFTELPSGCGVVVFSGYYNATSYFDEEDMQKFKNLLKDVLNLYRNYANIFTTIGHSEMMKDPHMISMEELLISLGFEKITTYANKSHGSEETQSMYLLI